MTLYDESLNSKATQPQWTALALNMILSRLGEVVRTNTGKEYGYFVGMPFNEMARCIFICSPFCREGDLQTGWERGCQVALVFGFKPCRNCLCLPMLHWSLAGGFGVDCVLPSSHTPCEECEKNVRGHRFDGFKNIETLVACWNELVGHVDGFRSLSGAVDSLETMKAKVDAILLPGDETLRRERDDSVAAVARLRVELETLNACLCEIVVVCGENPKGSCMGAPEELHELALRLVREKLPH